MARHARITLNASVKAAASKFYQEALDSNGKIADPDEASELLEADAYRKSGNEPYHSSMYRAILLNCATPHFKAEGHPDANNITHLPASYLAYVELQVGNLRHLLP
jgi:hypothetical protein